MPLFTSRAPTRLLQPLATFKNIAAREASAWGYVQLKPFPGKCLLNMFKMGIDLLFHNTEHLGQIPGIQLFCTQKFYNLLTNSNHDSASFSPGIIPRA